MPRTAIPFTALVSSPDENGCIPWLGALHSQGYGRVRVEGRQTYAHRYAWERLRGPIPVGMVIDHLCRNRACVNTKHMEVVTPEENVRRGIRHEMARRGLCVRGHRLVQLPSRRTCRECRAVRNRHYRARLREAAA